MARPSFAMPAPAAVIAHVLAGAAHDMSTQNRNVPFFTK